MKLTKNYWVLFSDKNILNPDYLNIQDGECNVGVGIEGKEFETLSELEIFVKENSLSLQDENNI